MASLARHRFRVIFTNGTAPLEDVTTVMSDQIAYEETRNRRKWPQITDGGVATWWTFLAWRAATRTEAWHGTYDEWLAAIIDVEDLTDDDTAAGEPVDPTRPAAPASLSSP